MRILKLLVLTLLLTCSVFATAQEKQKFGGLTPSKGFFAIDGVWRRESPPEVETGFKEATHFFCSAHNGKAIVGSEAVCFEATAQASPGGALVADLALLKVLEWSDGEIVAVRDEVCATSQEVFNVKDKTITKLRVRKSSPDCAVTEFGRNERETYYLQDWADYYLSKTEKK